MKEKKRNYKGYLIPLNTNSEEESISKKVDSLILLEEYQAKRERCIKLNKIEPDFDEEQCICDGLGRPDQARSPVYDR